MAKNKMTPDPLLITQQIGEETKAMVLYNTALEDAPFVTRSIASNLYENVYSPNISVKDGFDRFDYEYQRPEERIPRDEKGKIVACMAAYEESGNGLISNIIDLMADLVVQGIDVVHPKRQNEKFVKAWFQKTVKGPNFSERFANMLCRSGNVIVKRDTQKIPLSVTRKYYQGVAGVEDIKDVVVEKREIPVRYTILDVRAIDVFSPELTMFMDSGDMRFGLNIPSNMVTKIANPMTAQDQVLVDSIPKDIVMAIRNGSRLIPLDKNKVDAYYYKKDDWKVWATPMIYRVLSDIYALKKMKMADLSCIDGVLSQIRVWKIGSLEYKQRPGLAAMNRLASVLMNAVPGGILDLIWGPDLEMQEVSSQLHQFLGDTKYAPLLNAIYSGLGIPPIFTGATSQGSFTNNFLAIKTFIVRLEYIRDKLREFWNKEFSILQKALGWDEAPTLVFDRMTLNDESSILQIMLHLVDRGILSDEAIQEMVGAIPEIEAIRVKREWKDKQKGRKPPKASPFHKPDFKNTWIERFIMAGDLTPGQVGLELEPKGPGEQTPNESQVKLGIKGPKSKNDLTGRPAGKKDSKKRKNKTVKPQRGVGELIKLSAWSLDMQEKINEELTPIYLDMLGKKNLRQLTGQESDSFEAFKFGLLANIPPNSELKQDTLQTLIAAKQVELPELMNVLYSEMIKQYTEEHGDKPNIHQMRRIQSLTYAAFKMDETAESEASV